MTTSLSDAGIQFASGNLVDVKTAMPSTGSYTQGDVIVEKSVNGTLSGWKRLTTGSAHVLGTDWLYFSDGITLGTAQNTTSGTSIDFTSIPSWVKRITVSLNGVSTNSTSPVQIQLGSGSVVTTGYSNYVAQVNSGGNGASSNTSGFIAGWIGTSSTSTRTGNIVFTLLSSNIWVCAGICSFEASISGIAYISGSIGLSGALDRIRLTTVNGTDTFDAGSVNIMYE